MGPMPSIQILGLGTRRGESGFGKVLLEPNRGYYETIIYLIMLIPVDKWKTPPKSAHSKSYN